MDIMCYIPFSMTVAVLDGPVLPQSIKLTLKVHEDISLDNWRSKQSTVVALVEVGPQEPQVEEMPYIMDLQLGPSESQLNVSMSWLASIRWTLLGDG